MTFIIKLISGIALAAFTLMSIPADAKAALSCNNDGKCWTSQEPSKVHSKQARIHKKKVAHKAKSSAPVKMASIGNEPMHEAQAPSIGGDLVAAAKRYLGTNPTGWRSVWCGRFMALIAPSAAARVKNPNWARDWADLPRTAPRIGAIAVLTRGKKSGHIGVVTGFDSRGNPIIISGNHGRVVGEGVYSKHRVIAYVDG